MENLHIESHRTDYCQLLFPHEFIGLMFPERSYPLISGIPTRKTGDLYPQPRNHPDNLLGGHRVHDPGQDEPRYRYEKGPKYLLHLFVLPKRIDHRKVSRH